MDATQRYFDREPDTGAEGDPALYEARAAAMLDARPEHDEPRSDLVDALTDLMHWAGAHDIDFEAALIMADLHYEAEATA